MIKPLKYLGILIFLSVITVVFTGCEDVNQEIKIAHIVPNGFQGTLVYTNNYTGVNDEPDSKGFISIDYKGGKGRVSLNHEVTIIEEQLYSLNDNGQLKRNLRFVEGGICIGGRNTYNLVVSDTVLSSISDSFLVKFLVSTCGIDIDTSGVSRNVFPQPKIDRNPNGNLPLGLLMEYHLEDNRRIWRKQE